MGQWRRMCFVAVYAMDKATSTTLGRPPLLLRYHCVLDPPLDLDDGLDAADAAVEAARLDVRGWNRDGRRWAATFLRVQFLLATVREEVLELQAGVGGVHIPSRAQYVAFRRNTLSYDDDLLMVAKTCTRDTSVCVGQLPRKYEI